MWATGRESFGDFAGAGAAGGGGGGAGGGGAGGFMPNASQEPGTSTDKKIRGRTIAPVAIKQLLECKEDALKIEDMEIQTLVIVGLIRHVEVTTTRISFIVDDQSGVIEAVKHIGADDGVVDTATILAEGTYGRLIGLLRTPSKADAGKKYLVLHKAMPITDLNDIVVHLLEVLLLPGKLRKLKAAQEARIQGGVGGMDNTITSAMFGTSFGVGDKTLGAVDLGRTSTGRGGGGGKMDVGLVGPGNGFTAHQNMILTILKSCKGESGLHRDVICQNVKGKITAKEVENALEYLSGEGHIFSTVDDDHYKVTDW